VSGYEDDDREDIEDLDDPVDDYDDLHGDIVIDDYDDLDDADDDNDDYEDASPEEIDFVIALYKEDGEPVAVALAKPLANDLEDLIEQLRRLPGDAGACAFVSIASEFFVAVRVRGPNVQVLLNDSVAGADWPIARDALDFLGMEPPEDEESDVVGDLNMLADQGLSELDMEAIAGDYDEDSGDLVRQIVKHLGYERQVEAALSDE